MRYLFLIPMLAFVAPLRAQDGLPPDQHHVKKILEGPALAADEVAKIRFDAQAVAGAGTPTFQYRIYNGLRDKTIQGFVVTVSATSAKGDPESTDAFVSVDLEPLSSTQGQSMYFLNFGDPPKGVTFVLKQVLYQALPGAKPKP